MAEPQKELTRNIWLWTLYDFANSVTMIVFFLYFSQWLVVDHGVSDMEYNAIFMIGSVMLLLTAPVIGRRADRFGRNIRYLHYTTAGSVIFHLATTVTALMSGNAYLAMVFFILANYFYQFSFVFYNALLHDIAPRERWGKISGLGQTANWLGEIFGLVLVIPFANGTIHLFGEAGRAQTLLPATIVFFLLALPMILFFRLPAQGAQREDAPLTLTKDYRDQWRQFLKLIAAPSMGLFLLSYFFFNDAILTASNNFPIYLAQVFGVGDDVKSMLIGSVLVTAAIGAYISGWVTDRIGLKKALLIVIGSWAVLLPLLAVASNFRVFMGLTIVMGILFGAIWTVTRTAMTALCPKDQLNFGFSFYTLAERVSTLVGPLSWGLVTTILVDLGSLRYRIAMMTMGAFVVLGLLLLRKIKI